MIHIKWHDPVDPKLKKKWDKWIKKCAIEQAALNASHEAKAPKEINKKLYSELKVHYMSPDGPFYGKCAYCESRISADQPGDLDHFRPKGRVKEDDMHPGYYWLAYDYKNLLLSCADCNQPSSQKTTQTIGKWDRFPVKGFRALKSPEEDDEEPYLLNPINCKNIEEHFLLDEKFMLLIPLSPEAKMTLKILGLNERQGLRDNRRDAYENATMTVVQLYAAQPYNDPAKKDNLLNKISDIGKGKAAYSAFARAGCGAVQRDQDNMQKIINERLSDDGKV
ncbi:MAG TPA: hypothetical protein VGO50_20000 [Pyrinomonadaceae bacterium]|nr:hypothetical protein [Pyrinomonadaceae bacterium]